MEAVKHSIETAKDLSYTIAETNAKQWFCVLQNLHKIIEGKTEKGW